MRLNARPRVYDGGSRASRRGLPPRTEASKPGRMAADPGRIRTRIMTHSLQVIICSTRPGRIGPTVAAWVDTVARQHGAFDVALVDLADFGLPVYDEPKHPRLQQYAHEHTKRWAASVAAADAYVFVTPEYNSGPPPSIVNALNYVYREWNYKAAGIVSYGGVSGGLRAAEALKGTTATLKLVVPPEGVPIPMVAKLVEDGAFRSNDLIDTSAKTMLDELAKWSGALKSLREA